MWWGESSHVIFNHEAVKDEWRNEKNERWMKQWKMDEGVKEWRNEKNQRWMKQWMMNEGMIDNDDDEWCIMNDA